jgi:hypothetical protein
LRLAAKLVLNAGTSSLEFIFIAISFSIKMRASAISALACFVAYTAAQTFQRLGGCPDLGCIFPPDQYVMFQLSLGTSYLQSFAGLTS